MVNQYQARINYRVVQQLKDRRSASFRKYVPPSVLMKESHHKNLPLIHLATDHKLTQAYQSLFNEIVKNIISSRDEIIENDFC